MQKYKRDENIDTNKETEMIYFMQDTTFTVGGKSARCYEYLAAIIQYFNSARTLVCNHFASQLR